MKVASFIIFSLIGATAIACGASPDARVDLGADDLGATGVGPTIPTTEGAGTSPSCGEGDTCGTSTAETLTKTYYKTLGRYTLKCVKTYESVTWCTGKFRKNGDACECVIADPTKDCSTSVTLVSDSCNR